MSTPQIVGILLVKNEDCHVEQAIRNVIGFCDLLLVADHGSEDQTYGIVAALAVEFPKIRLSRIAHAAESHRMIEGYAHTDTWIFGVDGDEIYDPRGLAILRERLLAGQYDAYWRLFGNVLHCREWDRQRAKGYLAPPSLSMTKLYNFARILEWRDCPQRLHWGRVRFVAGEIKSLRICDETGWEESPFRCLHMAFLRRSSLQPAGGWRRSRYNLSELNRNRRLDWSLGFRHVLKQILVYPWTRIPCFDYKHRVYRKGPAVTVDAAAFQAAVRS
jgi:glycosyltransferase involved in cell wall biosynthesis